MENLKELSQKECEETNGGVTMEDFWYGVGYVGGTIANAYDAAIEWLEEQKFGNYYY